MMDPLNVHIVLFQIVFELYFLIPIYPLGFGLMFLIMCYVFVILYHIVVKINLLFKRHTSARTISRIWRHLVAESMYNLLVSVTSVSIKMLVKVFFLVMFPILTNSLFGMTKILNASKLLPMLNLMKVLMIFQSIIYH